MAEAGTVTLPNAYVRELVALADKMRTFLQEEEGIVVPGQGVWTRDMLETLRFHLKGAYPAASAMLALTAETPDEVVRYPQIVERSERTSDQVRAELGAMSKLSRKLFGDVIWPVRTWQGSDTIKCYMMPSAIAEWWLDND